MTSIAVRPERVTERAAEVMAASGQSLAGARVVVLGASYKGGVRDLRESPALPLMDGLARGGAHVGYYDPLIPVLELPSGRVLRSITEPRGADWDLAVVHTLHPQLDYGWAQDCPRVLDATYQFFGAPHRAVV
jgi:UDP-N-acetyl-D-mannosaminuronate dehydrogenase